jgi:hypothetical protein
MSVDPALGRVGAGYALGGNMLYLLCCGAACGAPTPTAKSSIKTGLQRLLRPKPMQSGFHIAIIAIP